MNDDFEVFPVGTRAAAKRLAEACFCVEVYFSCRDKSKELDDLLREMEIARLEMEGKLK